MAYHVFDPLIDVNVRLKCIGSFKDVYHDCFALRCAPIMMSTTTWPGTGTLNTFCYMWWEHFPSIGPERAMDPPSPRPAPEIDRYADQIRSACIDVMVDVLDIDHDACRESALHGLDHWCHDQSRRSAVIDDWLARHADLSPAMRAFAEAAKHQQLR